jgi:nicotinamide riboside transporter PnuC
MKNKKLVILNYSFFSAIMLTCVILTFVLKLNWLTLISCISGISYIVFLSDRNLLNFIVGFIV